MKPRGRKRYAVPFTKARPAAGRCDRDTPGICTYVPNEAESAKPRNRMTIEKETLQRVHDGLYI